MSDAKREAEGEGLLSEAEKKLHNRPSLFKSLFGSSSNGKEEAAELFTRAGNQFKLGKAWQRAGESFTRAAKTHESCGEDSRYDAAARYTDAGKMHKNGNDGVRAVTAFNHAVRIHEDSGRFQSCARLMREIGELHESNGEAADARVAFTKAADFYHGEGAASNASTMRGKAACIAASAGDTTEAAKLFEGVGEAALESNLLKYGAREHFLRAALCYCVDDHLAASRALERYGELDSSFTGSREQELLAKIVAAVDDGDVQAFTDAVYTFDSISKLDDWKTSILLKIKNNIRDAEDDLT